jgi:hypothetical protein
MEGKSVPATHLALQHLSLADRYWQFRLSVFRHSFITDLTQQNHFAALITQLMIDIHPIFGAYVLYLCALQTRLDKNFQGAVDHVQFAIEWLEYWRVVGAPWDLAQKVFPLSP